ncbi:MAG: helix-turn-helix domain-containing protein [Treponema sp.]|nr:helix-turn-helix domain-containing protein [Treponema sp.]
MEGGGIPLGLPQGSSLADMVEISHSHLYYIESKRVVPSIDVVIKLAKALKINLNDLFE